MANLAQAIRMALHYGEEHLGVTDVFGEDVGPPLGGVFTVSMGLKTAYNSPLDERGIVGQALGIAYAGGKPVAEIQFSDYIFNAIDLLKLCGNAYWSSYGEYNVPMVLMTPNGAGIHGSIYHSHSFESMATHIPGWKIVTPSNAKDAYGLMISAIKDPNPVMYLIPKALMRAVGEELIPGEPEDASELKARIDAPLGDRSAWKPRWPENLTDYSVPLGKAKLVREGKRATVISYARDLLMAVKAADELADEGLTFDVIDLRTLYPLDMDTITASVEKTGRVLVINEDTEITNYGEHVVRKIVDACFYHLEAPPTLLAGKDVPGIGISPVLEELSVPQPDDIKAAMRKIATEV
ncbi:MAG TPA: transketolase C-terminal domain-containing protein [Oscillatoriaceae cyanobacterium]